MTEEELREQMKKALSESLDVDAVMNLYMNQMENMFLKGFELGVNYLLPKGSRLRASSTQVGSLSYE